jgi:hypothetical protein
MAVAAPFATADDRPIDRKSAYSTALSQEQPRMWMTVGSQRFAVTLQESATARAFVALLPATLEMD